MLYIVRLVVPAYSFCIGAWLL